MRIGCLQFAPQLGDVDNNLNRADAVLHKANPGDLDLLVLPELAFSGYNFKNLQDIRPFLEHSGSGVSSLWARTMALKYNCTVAVGYPEKVEWSSTSSHRPIGPEYYNSAIVVNEDGETIVNYRKSFLYDTDETWAQEGGRGFYEGFIPGLGNVSIGICMDLNPYKFQAPWHAFEFAYHVLQMDSNLVIVSMAWITREDRRRFTSLPNEPDMETLSYWVTRLEPLIRSDNQDEIIVVFCNRTGHEDDVTYAGTSAVIGIQDGEVRVYGLLGRGQKELLVVDTNDIPYAKMVYRPDSSGDLEGELKSSDFNNPTDYDESMEDEEDYEEPASNHGFQNPSGDEEFKRSPVSTTSLSPPLPHSPEKAEGSIPHTNHLPIPIDVANETVSTDLDSVVAPTPPAPNPTTQAVRPRLIIPESPPILSYPDLSEIPNSATSLSSERSAYSVKSNESEASVATIRSNPRPPEDSTPYPGLHPSDYLSKDPMTALDDMSPVSTNWYWPPSNNTIHTPSTAGWAAGTPIGREPEPFSWSSVTSDMQPPSRQATSTHVKEPTTPQEVRNANSQSPLSHTSSHRTNKTHKTSRSDSSGASKRTVQERTGRDGRLARPSSPKPRNVSRYRAEERSKTPTAEIDVTQAISQYLDGISQQVKFSDRTRSESVHNSAWSERGRFSRSRDCSQDRTGKPESEHEMIRIAFSPSILHDDERSPLRPASRDSRRHQRSNSYSNVNGYLQGKESRSAKSNYAASNARPSSPSASRGRTQMEKVSLANGETEPGISETERTSSMDSTRNDRLHSRVRRRTESKQSRTRRPSSAQRPRRQSEEEVTRLEEPETIHHPGLQKHGRYASCGTLTSESAMLSGQSSPLAQTVSIPSTSPRRMSPFGFRDETLFSDDANSMHLSCSAYDDSPVSTLSGGAEWSDGGAPGTPPTTVTPKRLQAVAPFEPKTPKEVIIQMDEGNAETTHEK